MLKISLFAFTFLFSISVAVMAAPTPPASKSEMKLKVSLKMKDLECHSQIMANAGEEYVICTRKGDEEERFLRVTLIPQDSDSVLISTAIEQITAEGSKKVIKTPKISTKFGVPATLRESNSSPDDELILDVLAIKNN